METLPMMPEKNAACCYQTDGKAIWAGEKAAVPQGCNQIIIATDAGREGELVARWILKNQNAKADQTSVDLPSVTDKAIREGLTKPADGRRTTIFTMRQSQG